MPQIGIIINCPHPTLRLGLVHARCKHNNPPRHILAQGPEVDHKLLLSYAHRDTLGGVLPPTRLLPDHPPEVAGDAQGGLLPSQCEPGNSPPSPLPPFAFRAPGTRLLASLDQRPIVRLPPPTLHNAPPCPPYEEPPPNTRGGSSNNTLHPWAIQNAHDQFSPCLPDPHPPAPVPDVQHLFCPEGEGETETPRGVGLPFPNPGVLPAPSRPISKAVHGLG